MIKYVVVDLGDDTYLTTNGFGNVNKTCSIKEATFFETEEVAENYVLNYACEAGLQLYVEIRKILIFS
jgi:hypothetical protein